MFGRVPSGGTEQLFCAAVSVDGMVMAFALSQGSVQ